MYITGPWNLGEFRRRLPPEMAGRWATAPLPAAAPGAGGPGVSLAGGVEPRPFPHLAAIRGGLEAHRVPLGAGAAGALLRARGRPAGAARRVDGSRPRVRSGGAARSRSSSRRVVATPQLPEWEQIAQKVAEHLEPAIRGVATVDDAARVARPRRPAHPREAPLGARAGRRPMSADDARAGCPREARAALLFPRAGRSSSSSSSSSCRSRRRFLLSAHRLRPLRARRPCEPARRGPRQLPRARCTDPVFLVALRNTLVFVLARRPAHRRGLARRGRSS